MGFPALEWSPDQRSPECRDEVQNHLRALADNVKIPDSHVQYLASLRGQGFVPKVVYDIGSCMMHWSREASVVWPEATVVHFDGCEHLSFLYPDPHRVHFDVLSDRDGRAVDWYNNDKTPFGNSYYRELLDGNRYFPKECAQARTTRSLDSVVAQRGFPPPDMIKLDVQGCELDILRGATECLKTTRCLIVEMQHTRYNDGAPMEPETIAEIRSRGFELVGHRFSDNGSDADSCFVRPGFLRRDIPM